MNKKYFSKWISLLSCIAIITLAIIIFRNVSAANLNLNDIEKARLNTAIKVLAKNLQDCYINAQESIKFNINGAQDYESEVYWKNKNMQVYYPKTLAGKTGNEASSTCAKMIIGWKSNWIVKLFIGRGDFVGVDQNVIIPGEYNETDFADNASIMKQYLSGTNNDGGIGYKSNIASSTELNGYRCIYFNMTVYEGVLTGVLGYPAPANSSFDFTSKETYCVPVNNDGRIDFSKDLIVYDDSIEYSGNVIARDEAANKLALSESAKFGIYKFMQGDDLLGAFNKKFFSNTIYDIRGYYNPAIGQNLPSITIRNTKDACLDSNSVFVTHKDSIFSVTQEDCSLTDGIYPDEANTAIKLTFDQFRSRFKAYISKFKVGSSSSSDFVELFKSVEAKTINPWTANAEFQKGDETSFVSYFFEPSGKAIVDSGYTLDTAEQYMFYYDHLKNYFGVNNGKYLYDNKDAIPNAIEVWWLEDGTSKKFTKKYIEVSSGDNLTACALEGGIWSGDCGSGEKDWRYFAEKLGDFTESELETAFANISLLDDDYAEDAINQNQGDKDSAALCYSNSGPLGWVICPIVTAASAIGEHMWEQIETYHLRIPASEIFKKGGGVEQAWSTIRNIANILFGILFLVVIFSQLTGVGIDNYGIKRILPKLIVVAILMNLSYIICELAVDLSNILGVGLNSLLSGMADSLEVSIPSSSGISQSTAWVFDGVIGGGGYVLFQLLMTGSLLGATAAIGIAVLGIIITVVFSMLFLYLILIAREAGIVIAVILAPIAIVCYTLPNTEKFYKKWFDLFKALMIVYPICGAIVGAGQLAGAALASINTNSMKIAATIIQVLPFFLIPMLLKNSLSLMGNIGTKLSSLGKSIGHRGSSILRSGVQSSERFKDWSQWQKDNTAVRRAQRVQNRLEGRGNLSERQRDRLRKAQDIVLARRKQQRENEVRTRGGYATAMANKQDLSIEAEADAISRMNDPIILEAERQALAEEARSKRSKARTAFLMNQYHGEGLDQLIGRWNTAFDSNDADELDGLTNVIVQKYGTSGVNRIATSLDGKANVAGNLAYQGSLRTLQRTMNSNSDFAKHLKSKTPDAYLMISDAGMYYDSNSNTMVPADMSYFTVHNNVATSAKDWSTASTATLRRAVNSGVLSEQMLNELLTSNDPAIRSGIQSEQDKRQILERALYNMRHNPSGMGPIPSLLSTTTILQHEEDAMRRGKTTINIPSPTTGTPPTSFTGYAVPNGFNTGGAAPTRNPNGDYIYTDITTGRQWNATTGRYVR